MRMVLQLAIKRSIMNSIKNQIDHVDAAETSKNIFVFSKLNQQGHCSIFLWRMKIKPKWIY